MPYRVLKVILAEVQLHVAYLAPWGPEKVYYQIIIMHFLAKLHEWEDLFSNQIQELQEDVFPCLAPAFDQMWKQATEGSWEDFLMQMQYLVGVLMLAAYSLAKECSILLAM